MDISIESLHLDLRGVPRHVAEAVPSLLLPALQEAVANQPFDRPTNFDRLPEVHLTLRQADTAPALARQIATAVVRSFQTSASKPQTPIV